MAWTTWKVQEIHTPSLAEWLKPILTEPRFALPLPWCTQDKVRGFITSKINKLSGGFHSSNFQLSFLQSLLDQAAKHFVGGFMEAVLPTSEVCSKEGLPINDFFALLETTGKAYNPKGLSGTSLAVSSALFRKYFRTCQGN